MARKILTMPEVSTLTRRPIATLRYWRTRNRGEGPRSYKLGRAVVYDETDVLAWLDEQRAKDGEPAA